MDWSEIDAECDESYRSGRIQGFIYGVCAAVMVYGAIRIFTT